MAGIAIIVGTLFWFVMFLGFMVTFFVLFKGGFDGKALVEGALAIIITTVLAVPLSFIARKIASRVVRAADGEEEPPEATDRGYIGRRNRRQG